MFRTSTYSINNGECVEVDNFRKATFSFANGNCAEIGNWRKTAASQVNGHCVETGNTDMIVAVRDTKQDHLGDRRTILEFPADTWTAFTQRIKGQ